MTPAEAVAMQIKPTLVYIGTRPSDSNTGCGGSACLEINLCNKVLQCAPDPFFCKVNVGNQLPTAAQVSNLCGKYSEYNQNKAIASEFNPSDGVLYIVISSDSDKQPPASSVSQAMTNFGYNTAPTGDVTFNLVGGGSKPSPSPKGSKM